MGQNKNNVIDHERVELLENVLEKERSYFEGFVEVLPDPLVVTNEDGHFLVANEAFKDLVHCPNTSDKNISDFFYTKNGVSIKLHDIALSNDVSCWFVWKGKKREIILTRRQIHDKNGSLQNIFMFKDVTNFNKQSRDFASLTKLNPSPVFSINVHGKVIKSNIVAKILIDIIEKTDWFSISKVLNKDKAVEIISNNQIHVEELVIKDISFYFQYRGIKSENCINVYGFDVTEERLKEQKIKELQDELIEHAYSQGIAENSVHVLHNIGNVLTSMIGKGDFLKKELLSKNLTHLFGQVLKKLDAMKASDLNDESFEKLKTSLGKIYDGFVKEEEKFIEANEFTLRESLRISEIISTQQKYANCKTKMNSIVKICDLIEDTVKMHQYRFDKRGIEIDISVDKGALVMVEKIGLSQTISNAIINAIESIDDKSNLGIVEEPWRLSIFSKVDNSFIELTIKDNGLGIKNEDLDKIFAYGFSTKQRGSGFGLHNCANYMQGIGGEIKIESDGEFLGAQTILRIPLYNEEV